MTNASAQNRPRDAGRLTGPGVDDAPGPPEGREPPVCGTARGARKPALALHMGLPGSRLDMVLGGPRPLLVGLVRHLARAAARAGHAAETAGSPMIPMPDPYQEDL